MSGYWIPHAAAKAIAATFCYEIRYALTPVFGHDFPTLCVKPDSDSFGDMTIDPAITQHCQEEARSFREEELRNPPHILSPGTSSRTPSPSLQRAGHRRATPANILRSPYDSPVLSAYDSDISSDDNYSLAPPTPPVFRNPWTAVNTFKTPPRSVPYPNRGLPSPRSILDGYRSRPTVMVDIPMTPPATIRSRESSVELSPTSLPTQPLSALRSTCDNKQSAAAESDETHERLSGAISLLCTATGLSRAELTKRLDLSSGTYNFDKPLDAAITMISLKTGLTWNEIVSRLNLGDYGTKRATSW